MALIEIAAADGAMSTMLSIQNSLIVSALVKDGTAAQKAELLPDLIAGKTIGAFVLTEADAGSDASAVQTRATRVEGGYRLNCAKQFLASGCIAGLAAVFAVTEPSAKKRRLGLPRQNECAGSAPPRCRRDRLGLRQPAAGFRQDADRPRGCRLHAGRQPHRSETGRADD
jgi:Acyl-CoA dehydrogenase, middle domain/Acyl-CoA dehydrogenase, N-terminal domain